MSKYTVEQLAKRSGLPVTEIIRLLEVKAGIKVVASDEIKPEMERLILGQDEQDKPVRKKLSLSKLSGKGMARKPFGPTVTIKRKARVVARTNIDEQKPVVKAEEKDQVAVADKQKSAEVDVAVASQGSDVSGKEKTNIKESDKLVNESEKPASKAVASPASKAVAPPASKTVAPPASKTVAPSSSTSSVSDRKKKKKGRGYEGRDKGWGRHKEIPMKKDGRFGHNAKKERGKSAVSAAHKFEKPTAPVAQEVVVPEAISVVDLAQRCHTKVSVLITMLMKDGMMVQKNQMLDQEMAALFVEMLGHRPILQDADDVERDLIIDDELRYEGEAISRAPVVTFMGHVDHGKTTLLDYIRRTRVTAGEAGGITQHIGAYSVVTATGGKITFLDTPGHAAFTQMRARGVKCTDIVVLVVAADDGVMPQTIEAIEHAKAADVPILVAVNKIDKPEADEERVKNELSGRGVVCESWGGDAIFQGVSAKEGTGVEQLLEAISLQAEVLELKAHVEGPAKGVVIESRLDKGRGPVATVLVQAGQLKQGDVMLAGKEFGRVRAMIGGSGASVKQAGPSEPVEVLGLSGVPEAGDEAIVVKNEKKAREIAIARKGSHRERKLASTKVPTFSDVLSQVKLGQLKELPLILKADTHGSVEAITQALLGLSNEEVKVIIVSAQVGGIAESDINLALASKAIILGFNVRADVAARRLSDKESVEISYFSIIYNMIDTIKSLVNGMIGPKYEERIIGQLAVKEVFRSSKFGLVSGCLVTDGVIKSDTKIRILRDNIVLHEGEVSSLRHYRDEVKEVKAGSECGVGIKDYTDIRQGDQFEVFVREQVKQPV